MPRFEEESPGVPVLIKVSFTTTTTSTAAAAAADSTAAIITIITFSY